MKLLLQRVKKAAVYIDDFTVGTIDYGVLMFVGFCKGDNQKTVDQMVEKIKKFRFFHDQNGKMNLNIVDVKADILIVSQFTLCANTRKGTRPSFDNALSSSEARQLYDYFITQMRIKFQEHNISTGKFGAYMQVSLINDGPVTFMLEIN